MNIRLEIIAEFRKVGREQGRRLAPLTDQLTLLESGLNSLCFAIVVSRLERSLGTDPFSADESAPFPVTFGDFVRFYEKSAK